jgi:uncharacterized membrane protein
MPETDYAEFETKTGGDRTVMQVLYGMHTVAPFTAWTLAVLALIANYIKRGGEQEPLYLSHHSYMIATFWWTLLWLIVTGPLWLVFILPGWIAYGIIGLWYIYRCVRGWLRFNEGRLAY